MFLKDEIRFPRKKSVFIFHYNYLSESHPPTKRLIVPDPCLEKLKLTQECWK